MKILEIGSGSGQHAIYFAEQLPNNVWLPSDQGSYYPGLCQNVAKQGRSNLLAPVQLDLNQPSWPEDAQILYAANVVHIMPEALLPRMFTAGTEQVLLYGPYKYSGEFTTESNANFDIWLKTRNPLSGIRDIEVTIEHADNQGYALVSDTPMPANNQFLVFQRR